MASVKTLGAIGLGAAALTIGGIALANRKKSSSTAKRRKKRSATRRSGRYTPRTAGKGKDRSTKRIRYTKNGQPYVLLRSGKAKFIKRSSAKRSHRRKGGRY